MTKYKPYSTYKSSGVEWLGDVPEHWECHRLKSTIVSSINGTWGDEPKDDQNDMVCVRVADFNYSRLGLSSINLTLRNIEPSQQLSRTLLKNDLLVEKSGGGENQLVGRVVSFDLSEKAVCSNFIARLVVGKAVNHRFLCYVFAAMYSVKLNIKSIKQTTGIQNLDLYSYLCEIFCIPSLQEQISIAHFLDRETTRIDTLVTKKRELIDLLEKKRAAIVTEAVTKGCDRDVSLKKGEVEWSNEVPAHWKVVRLKFLAHSIQTGPFGSQLHSDDYSPGGIPVINPLHLSKGRIYPDFDVAIDDETWQRLSRHELQEGDIVFARRGEIGRCGLVTSIEAGWLCGTGSMRLRPNQNVVLPSFIVQVLSTRGAADQLLLDSVGSTMDNLNTKTLSNLLLPVPPSDEQKTIIKYLKQQTESLDNLIKKIEESIDDMTKHRQALITAAVTGKIDVQEEIKRDRGVA